MSLKKKGKAMKRSFRGFFGKLLKVLILLGIVSAVLLVIMGFQKADAAEEEKVPVSELYDVYAKDGTDAIPEEILSSIFEAFGADYGVLAKYHALLGDDTAAALITKTFYLPDDDLISTAVGQRVLIYRLKKAYSERELAAIYCGIMGYAPQNESDLLKLMEAVDLEEVAPQLLGENPLILDILTYLKEHQMLSEETLKKFDPYLEP